MAEEPRTRVGKFLKARQLVEPVRGRQLQTNENRMRIIRQTGWAGLSISCGAAVMAAGMSFVTAPVHAAFELPEGERITHFRVVARSIPQKEEYELYDPKIGKNFDLKKFWMRGDLRVRYEMRNGVCFGSVMAGNTGPATVHRQTTPNGTPGKANDFYAQQLTRLGFGYDLSPDVNFYMELQDIRVGRKRANRVGRPRRCEEP